MNPGINREVFSLALVWDAEQRKNSINTMCLVDLYGNEDSCCDWWLGLVVEPGLCSKSIFSEVRREH